MPKNWKRNCPAKRVSPIAPSRGQETGGRARDRAGSEAMRNRSAASWGGEKDASPILVAMKATPQITTTRRARQTSVGVMLEGARRVLGQVASQTRPEGACNARRTCMYVERCRRPRTWLFELSSPAARRGLSEYGEANWPSTDYLRWVLERAAATPSPMYMLPETQRSLLRNRGFPRSQCAAVPAPTA